MIADLQNSELLKEIAQLLKRQNELLESTLVPESVRIMDIGDVANAIGVSRPTIYQWMSQGNFPQPRQLSVGRSGWLIDDLRPYLETLPRGVATAKRHRAKEVRK